MKLKKIILVTVPLLLAVLIIASINLGAFANSNNELYDIPDPGPKVNATKVMYKWGVKLFTTTTFDYRENQEYFDKRFGIGEYDRIEFNIIETNEVKYNPHPSAIEKNYPIVHVETDKNGNILNKEGLVIEINDIGKPLNVDFGFPYTKEQIDKIKKLEEKSRERNSIN